MTPDPPPIAELIENVEWLIGSESPERIAARLGYRTPSLARRLARNGRPDLAAHFDTKVPA